MTGDELRSALGEWNISRPLFVAELRRATGYHALPNTVTRWRAVPSPAVRLVEVWRAHPVIRPRSARTIYLKKPDGAAGGAG